MADLMKRFNVNDYAASVRIFAVKPFARLEGAVLL